MIAAHGSTPDAGTEVPGLVDVARELYPLPPAEFVVARNERADGLRKEQPELARAVKELPKPVLAAWLTTLALRERADLIEPLLDLGKELREAHRGGDVAAVRALDRQRRAMTTNAVRELGALAEEHGQLLSAAVADQVAATLHAAVIDDDARLALSSGTLTKPLQASGFGAVDLFGALGAPSSGRTSTEPASPPDRRPGGERAHAEAETAAARRAAERAGQELTAAQRAAAQITRELEAAAQQHQQARAAALQAESELDELRRQLAEREHAAEQAAHRAAGAQREHEQLQRRHEAAAEAVARTTRHVAEQRLGT